jgi:exodeoxyribonuclease V gamma subunit
LSIRRLNPVADALLRVLELADSRLEASSLVDLLSLEPVRLRFDLAPQDLPTIQTWIQHSSIRWARDADHRERCGQPSDPQNTWRFGLRRLLLGVVMADDGRLLTGEHAPGRLTDVRPFDDMEGAETLVVGKLVDFCNTLFDVIDGLGPQRTMVQWTTALLDVVDRLTSTTIAGTWLTQRVRETIGELSAAAKEASSARLVTLDAMRSALAGRFDVASRGTREQCGAVTFCAMRPMRSVPYQVICLLGMDEDAFPRKASGFAFDLASQHPRVGDMDPRDEDRYLMLEALLAARRNLVVLYSSRDPRTNKHKPPCVPISELEDLIDQSFPPSADGRTASCWMTTEHPLQAFSPRVFLPLHRSSRGGKRPWSFDRRLRAAAEARRGTLAALAPFLVARGDPVLRERPKPITLGELVHFFKNPAKFLLQRRLKIDLDDRAQSIPDREPIELDHLQRWSLRQALLDHRIRGLKSEQVLRALRAEGSLPLGFAGKVTVEQQSSIVEQMLVQSRLACTAEELAREPSDPIAIDVSLAGLRLTGSLTTVRDALLIDLQFGDEDAGRIVGAWLSLLAWHAARPQAAGKALVVIGKLEAGRPVATMLGFEPPVDPRGTLEALIRLYLRGIHEPLPLFPRSSLDFAKSLASVTADASFFADGLPQEPEALAVVGKAFECAHKAWLGGFHAGDVQDPYIGRLFAGSDPIVDESVVPVPLDLDFARLALTLWGPVRRARRTSSQAGAWLQQGTT